MPEKTVRAGQLWVRHARQRLRIRSSDRQRYRTFVRAVASDDADGNTSDDRSNVAIDHDYRREFLTLDARNKLITAVQDGMELKNLTKLEIKSRLFVVGVPVPLTYLTIANESEIPSSTDYLMRSFRDGFVIKPNDGHSGRGIVIIKQVIGHRFITNFGTAWDKARLALHLQRILEGKFSRTRSDIVLIEELLSQHHRLRALSGSGLVDFRVIVSHGYPVMAMARIPTKRSRGKGNLHRGAIGMGIALHSGILTSGVLNERPMTHHPDSGMKISGLKIPYWEDILITAVRAQFFSGMNYAGVDLVVDDDGNVRVLEVNRRPGLAIQLANRAGLRSRLEFIAGIVNGTGGNGDNGHESESLKARIVFSQSLERKNWRSSTGGGAA